MAKQLRKGIQIVDHANGLKPGLGVEAYVRAADGDLKYVKWNSLSQRWESDIEEGARLDTSRKDGRKTMYDIGGVDGWYWGTGGTDTPDPAGEYMSYDGRTTAAIRHAYFDQGYTPGNFDMEWQFRVPSVTAENPCYWEISVMDAYLLANGGVRARLYWNGSYVFQLYDQADNLLEDYTSISYPFDSWLTMTLSKRGAMFRAGFNGVYIDGTVTTWDEPEQTYWGIRVADCVLDSRKFKSTQSIESVTPGQTNTYSFYHGDYPLTEGWGNSDSGEDINVQKWVTAGLQVEARAKVVGLGFNTTQAPATMGLMVGHYSWIQSGDPDYDPTSPDWDYNYTITQEVWPIRTAAVLDDFNRADGGLGANWTDIVTADWDTPAISSNKVSSNNADVAAYWDTTLFDGVCQEVFCEFQNVVNLGIRLKQPATDYHGIWVKVKQNPIAGTITIQATRSDGTAPHTGDSKTKVLTDYDTQLVWNGLHSVWVHTERVPMAYGPLDPWPIRVRVYIPMQNDGMPNRPEWTEYWDCVADWFFYEVDRVTNPLDDGYIGFTTSTGDTDYSLIDNFGGGNANPIKVFGDSRRFSELNESWISGDAKYQLVTDWDTLVIPDHHAFVQAGWTWYQMESSGGSNYTFSGYDGAPNFRDDDMVFLAVNSTREDGTAASKPTITSADLTWTEVDDVVYDNVGSVRSRLTVWRAHNTFGDLLLQDVEFDYSAVNHRIAVMMYSCSSCLNTGTNGANAIVQTDTASLLLTKPTKADYEAAVVASVPTGYWKLDETSGSTFNDSSVGSPNDLTKAGTPTMGGDSPFSDSAGLETDGDTTADASGSLPQTGFDTWTLECMVMVEAGTDDISLMHNGDIGVDGYGLRGETDSTPYLRLSVPNDGSSGFGFNNGPWDGEDLEFGVWYHVVVRMEPDYHKFDCFIDGIRQSSSDLVPDTPTTGFYLLKSLGTDSSGWHLTQAAIYDRALTDEEIWDHAAKSQFLSDRFGPTMAAKANPNNAILYFFGGNADKEYGNVSHDYPSLRRVPAATYEVLSDYDSMRDTLSMCGIAFALDDLSPEFAVRNFQGYIETSKSSIGNGFGVIGLEIQIDPAYDNVPSLGPHSRVYPSWTFSAWNTTCPYSPARIYVYDDIVSEYRFVK